MSEISQNERKPDNKPVAEAAEREPTLPPPDRPPAIGPPPTEEDPLSLRRLLRCVMGRSVGRCVDSFVRRAEPYSILLAVVALFGSLVAFRSDLDDRMEERRVQAWQLLTTKTSGNSGKREALEYLNSEHDGGLCLGGLCLLWPPKTRTPLVGLDLSGSDEAKLLGHSAPLRFAPGAYLWKVQLPNADLRRANLELAELYGADLTGANLYCALLNSARLSDAELSGADLSYADLSLADLRGANLSGVILRNAYLTGTVLRCTDRRCADLSGADLRGAKLKSHRSLSGDRLWPVDLSQTNVSQEQLDTACGDEHTKLPDGLTIRPCEEEVAERCPWPAN